MRVGTYFDGSTGDSPRLALFTADDRVIDAQAALVRLQKTARFADVELLRGAPLSHGWLTPRGLDLLRGIFTAASADPELRTTFRARSDVRLGPPVPRPGKFIAAGRNYMDHLREGQRLWKERGKDVQQATFPTAFAKFTSALTGDGDAIVLPAGVENVDYEIELVVVIGKPALRVPVQDALQYAAGYTICNDVAARKIQREEMEHQIGIVMAKNFPTFAPLGPWLVTADEIPDPQQLDLELRVNDDVRQHANTADMIFPVAELISYWSRLGLQPGDMITTGTPAGVAVARPDPAPFYLKHGDVVRASIENIGTLRNPVQSAAAGD